MNATDATNFPSASNGGEQPRWTLLGIAPEIPVLPAEHHEEFFNTAPVGTIAEVYDDLYMRRHSGDWAELENIVGGDGFYTSATHDSSSPAQLLSWASSDRARVRILRIGDAPRWS